MLTVLGINFAQKANLASISNHQQPRIKMYAQPMQDCVSFSGLPANFGEVIEGKLLRSAKPNDFKALLDKGVKYVVDLRDILERQNASEQELIENLGIEYHTAPDGFSDLMPHDPEYLPTLKTLAEKIQGLMDKNDGAVLVHCSKGEARTGDVIAAHQYYIQQLSASDIIEDGKKYNPKYPARTRTLVRFMQVKPL